MRVSVLSFVAAACLSLVPLGAQAGSRANVRTTSLARAPALAASSDMRTYAPGTTPFGWADFCQRGGNHADCDAPVLEAASIASSPKNWAAIDKVNRFVNDAIEPATDLENYGVEEYWAYPDNGRGDCEDYVLLKRRMLMQAGFARQALLITIVRDPAGEGHAVLTLKSDTGDFILDNKTNVIKAWSKTPYLFVKRQSQEDPNLWLSLRGRDAPLVAASGAGR